MTMNKKVKNDPRAALFDVLEDHQIGMLGVAQTKQHMQPMTHFSDRELGCLWFVTSKTTDLVRATGIGARAEYCLASPEGDFYTSLTGTLEQSADRAKLDELWNIVTSAWFEEGRDDPDVALLRFTIQEAAMWSTTGSRVFFGLEIARSAMSSEHEPEVGEHLVVRFDEAA